MKLCEQPWPEAPESTPWVERWDRLVAETPGIDPFCASSRWALPAWRAFAPEATLLFGEAHAGAALVLLRPHSDFGEVCHALEAAWGFACPVAGPRLVDTVVGLVRALWAQTDAGLLVLSGLPLEARLGLALGRALDGVAQIVRGPKTERARASLEGGFPGYLSRRSRGFRRSARRSTRRLEAEGVTFEAPGFDRPWPEVYQRVLSVDGRSWKGRDGVGIGQGAMRRFYEEMGTRLWRQRSLRVLFARREGRDVAYHFGAVLGDLYRGLQHAYDEALRPLGLGAATHLEMIRRVAGEGIAIYDLGQEIAYKARWAELGLVTQTLYLTRSAPPGSPGKARP